MRNLEYGEPKVQEIEQYIKTYIESYRDAREKFETAWEKYSRAILCKYNEYDHGNPGTTSKVFDSETHDAQDTIVKRVLVAFFSNPEITKLSPKEIVDPVKLAEAEAFWTEVLNEQNLYKTFRPILWAGGQTGTFMAKVQNEYTERNILKTNNKSDKRETATKTRNRPTIKFIDVYDLLFNPLCYEIEDSEVIAEKMVIEENVLKQGEKEKVFFNIGEPNPSEVYTDEEGYKEQIYWDEGIDVTQLKKEGKRAIYHCFFNWEFKPGEVTPMYAVIDCADGHIMRLEKNIYDDGEIPIVTTHYVSRNNCGYGVGIPELAWGLQIQLNNVLNRIQDNIEVNNSGSFFVGQASRQAMSQFKIGNHKLIPVNTVKDIMQVAIGGIPEAYQHALQLREQIQKKTKATRMLQGMPMTGDRTATEAMGVREESNVTIKEILMNLQKNFLEPLFNKYKKVMVQFYSGKKRIKVPINPEQTKFEIKEIDFKDVREVLEKCTVSVVGAGDVETKIMKRQQLKEILMLSYQVPGQFNTNYLLKKLLFDDMGFEDFDKMIGSSQPGQPLSLDEEDRILFSGEPLNISIFDNHQEHYAHHMAKYQEWLDITAQGLEQQEMNDEQRDQYNRVRINTERHIQDTMTAIQGQQNGQR